MPFNFSVAAALLLTASVTTLVESQAEEEMIYPKLQTYLSERAGEFDEISAERRTLLKQLFHREHILQIHFVRLAGLSRDGWLCREAPAVGPA